jgi:hypothetical protein
VEVADIDQFVLTVVGLDGEGAPGEAGGVRHGEDGADDEPGGGVRAEPAVHSEERVEALLLADEAEQRWQSGHGGTGDEPDDADDRQRTAEPAQRPQITGVDGVVDDADDHEQRRLEQGVGDEHDDTRDGGLLRAGPEQGDQQAELADGAEGEDLLEVRGPQGPQTADEHGGHTDGDHERRPPGERFGCTGGHAGEEEHARLHHGGGVQVGAHRGGCGHGQREPAVERHLGGLGAAGEQHEEVPDGGHARGGCRLDDAPQGVRARLLLEEDHAAEQRQTAEAGGEQGLQGRRAGGGLAVLVPDEQVAGDRGELPADEQRERLVGQDQTEHGAAEHGERRSEPCEVAAVLREVGGRVDEDQDADAGHQQAHDQAESVQPEAQIHAQRRHPRHALLDEPAVGDRGDLADQPRGCGQRREGAQPEHPRAEAPGDGCSQGRCGEMADQHPDHAGLLLTDGPPWPGEPSQPARPPEARTRAISAVSRIRHRW